MFFSLLAQQTWWLKSLICGLFTFLAGFVGISTYLKFLANRNIFRQPIREDGPKSHLGKKNTPTMGGVFIVLSTILATLIFGNLSNSYILAISLIFFFFATIGLIDDLMKVLYKNTKGFRGSIKLVLQFFIIGATILLLGSVNYSHFDGNLFLPINGGFTINITLPLYILLVNFVIVGSSNSVNLTDGLDGLVSLPAIISLTCFIVILYFSGIRTEYFTTIFHLDYESSKELIVFCASLIGGIFAFLCFNLRPAKIFMGDVGSLSIGSVLGFFAVILKQEIVFFFIALLFVIEALSVILQVGSYKLRGTRIFLMAPLHHHFEKKGLSEELVVKMFWLSSLIFAAFGMLLFTMLA